MLNRAHAKRLPQGFVQTRLTSGAAGIDHDFAICRRGLPGARMIEPSCALPKIGRILAGLRFSLDVRALWR
jgi:hypothetical protein